MRKSFLDANRKSVSEGSPKFEEGLSYVASRFINDEKHEIKLLNR